MRKRTKRMHVWTLALALLALGGCTVQGSIRRGPYWLTRAGVNVFETGPTHKEFVGLCVFAPVYFPLMAVLDTVALPFTWPYFLTPEWTGEAPAARPAEGGDHYAAWRERRHAEDTSDRSGCCHRCGRP